MSDTINELLQIKGVGETLAKRLVEAGFDNLQRLAAANAEDLNAIKGLQPAAVSAILSQARKLATGNPGDADDKSLAGMLEDAERLRLGISGLVMKLREQNPDGDDSKVQRQLRKEITRVLATLERVEASLSAQLRKLGKKLAKADAKLAGLPQEDLEALTRELRDTRKAIDKLVRP